MCEWELAGLSGDDDGNRGAGGAVCRSEEREEKRRGWVWVFGVVEVLQHLNSERQREMMDEFIAIGAVVQQESVPSIALQDAKYAIGQVCHGKEMIGVFSVSYCVFVDEWELLWTCRVDLSVGPLAAFSASQWISYLLQGGIEIASGNYIPPRRAGTAALYGRALSSDFAHSACALPRCSSSGARRSASQRQVVGVQRVSPLPASGSAAVSAHACACLSPATTGSVVIVQLFHQPELSRVPHGQFFSNCREYNITFDFEGKCGVLFQLAGHLIAGVVGFVACERLEELAARTAAREPEVMDVQRTTIQFSST
ncbi:uncharacterized protein MONOS_13560 [Monocercomonoides exilis]|uniref:uncharacterized protein n=1 Tax=Monocercomonoides exilis TaxID=2049356 RepID=UPI00355AAC70|nr:hypothetical protein MONOS_13560 [Monocercomonoides exilis]|eukprot:MONOS_13560.1-p1 / transcript=MONOS_13560.1 / gene=MONOS_13560 / organism=Monocercomonoides_exilis_PA203 / gene_product=unspecified product / transcript_product=unspecified product / location=Mono_scaffold00845:5156-6180(+) / protein_length=312 / sequence_SO=supercontig / SO=protein_coding / is_pseudo=false